jgi:hypothetical protein
MGAERAPARCRGVDVPGSWQGKEGGILKVGVRGEVVGVLAVERQVNKPSAPVSK